MTTQSAAVGSDGRKIHNYKQLKEAHVSNLSGGSIWEINEVTLVLPVSYEPETMNDMIQNTDIIEPGGSIPVVCPAIAAVLLHTILDHRRTGRLHHQQRRHPVRHHCLCRQTIVTECSFLVTCYLGLSNFPTKV